jgi:hypothetical protein
MTADADWPFDDPPNVAVVTTTYVMRHGRPIAYVSHDEDDGGWQFHSDDPFEMKHAMLVGLKEVVKLDPAVKELADLPPGWRARRDSAFGTWIRERNV